MKFKYAKQDLAIYGHDVNTDIAQNKRIAQEYEAFTLTLNDWAKLKEQELQTKKAAMAEKSIKWIISLLSIFNCLNIIYTPS